MRSKAKGPGTIMERMAGFPDERACVEFVREPLRLGFLAIFLEGRHKTGISALQLQKDPGPGSYGIASAWLNELHSTLHARPGLRLAGPVASDETYVGAKHRAVVQGDPARAAKILPWSHIVLSHFKDWLRGTSHRTSRKHLPEYLQEFLYRTNRRWLEHDPLFFYILRRAVQGKPRPWARLAAEATA